MACAGESLLAPQEILVALLTLNPQAEGLPLKAITLALTRCFEMLDPEQGLVFHPQALASTMDQLVVRHARRALCPCDDACSGMAGLIVSKTFSPFDLFGIPWLDINTCVLVLEALDIWLQGALAGLLWQGRARAEETV